MARSTQLSSNLPEPHAADVPVFEAGDEVAYADFFHENGFVVVGGVLTDDRVEKSLHEVWESPSLLGGHSSLKRDDPRTWGIDAWPAGCRNFLDPLDPCAEQISWQNRVDPLVNQVFDVLWRSLPHDEENGGKLVMSVDRFGVMRPTQIQSQNDIVDGIVEKPEWRTSRNWLHWDQNPWSTPGFHAVQGLLSLSAPEKSGCFVTVPKFHKVFSEWVQNNPEGSIPQRSAKMIPFAVPLQDDMQERRIKVPVPPGCLLVWDSRMPHENFPNQSTSWRLVQYVTCKFLAPEDLERRAAAWQAGLRTGLIPSCFARRFSTWEQTRLGMVASEEEMPALLTAIEHGESLSPIALEAASKLRRAYRLKQIAETPSELQEATRLFREAFAVNPDLKEPLQRIAAAESTYLPFWLL